MGATATATATSPTGPVPGPRPSRGAGTGDGIDDTVLGVEQLYQTITGRAPPPATERAETPIPPEKDAGQYVQARLEHLLALLGVRDVQSAAFSPPASVWRAHREMLITLDMPGMQREDIPIEVTGNTVTVSGIRDNRETASLERPQLVVSEHARGPCRRTLVLPPHTNAEHLEARMQDGVLTLRVPYAEPAASLPRDVPVT